MNAYEYGNEIQPPLENLLHSSQVPLLKTLKYNSFDLDLSAVLAPLPLKIQSFSKHHPSMPIYIRIFLCHSKTLHVHGEQLICVPEVTT